MKILKVVAIIATVTLALAPDVASAKWVKVIESKSGNELFVGNMWRDGNVVKFWQSIINISDEKPISTLIEANCKTAQFQIVQIANSDKIFTERFPVQQATLGTLNAAGISYACAKTGL